MSISGIFMQDIVLVSMFFVNLKDILKVPFFGRHFQRKRLLGERGHWSPLCALKSYNVGGQYRDYILSEGMPPAKERLQSAHFIMPPCQIKEAESLFCAH